MERIFFEKQEGNLCAQHALNALLQSQIFSVLDLGEIARRLDSDEAILRSAETGSLSADGTTNMDDSGFFSIQVIQEALKVAGLELINYSGPSPRAIEAREDPTVEIAYICNFREHWFTIRKLGLQWFNLNSVLKGPELVSDTYLKLFLAQLLNEGYSIYIVSGPLPDCTANDYLLLHPVDPIVARFNQGSSGAASGGDLYEEDPELAAALALSREEADKNDQSLSGLLGETAPVMSDEENLRRAIQMSLDGTVGANEATTAETPATTVSPATLRRNREKFLKKLEKNNDAN